MRNLVIEEIKKLENDIEELSKLSKLLKMVVNDGASIGFCLHWNKKMQQSIGKQY